MFNQTPLTCPTDTLIHELFEEYVRGNPEAIAIEHQDQQLTYLELNARANRLARCLISEGVVPDQPVGICVERGVNMVVGLLATLKAGAAYLPLDPSYPRERLRDMVEDAAPPAILVQRSLAATLPESAARVLVLEEKLRETATGDTDNLSATALGLHALNLVYIIFTSGSTGRPKGTAMTHRSMANLLQWHRHSFPVCAGQRVLQFAALSFDVAFQEIFSTVCTGGTLVLLQEWVRQDPQALLDLLTRRSVQRLFIPPLMLQSLSDHARNSQTVPLGLEDVVTAGEQLRVSPDIVGFFRRLPGCRLHNHYGPTETHVVTALTLTEQADEWPALPAIGRPVSHTQIHVLDEQGHPVPADGIGEIYIGGVALARGYLGRAQLTAYRFVADPFSAEPGARLYRTGDLGRWHSDGVLEYLGRNDHQVKVRGFRIELNEIENRLLEQEAIKEAVVLAREDSPGNRRLVAYVTVDEARLPEGQLVASWPDEALAVLRDQLPRYMVPSALVVLAEFPRNSNGKLDRLALPSPGYVRRDWADYKPPREPVESRIAALWRELLHLERVDRRDNFFDLGGHSLLIMQMLERLRRRNLSADVSRLFAAATLEEFAREFTEGARRLAPVPEGRIPPGCQAIEPAMLPLVDLAPEHISRIVSTVPGGAANVQDVYPLSSMQEGMLFHHLLNPHAGDTYVHVILLSVESESLLQSFISSLQKVIDRHDSLRTAILWEQLPRAVQVVWRKAELPVDELVLDPRTDALEQLRELMRPELQRLNLTRAPLLRLQVTSSAPEGSRWVLFQLHHAVHDLESLAPLFTEVIDLIQGHKLSDISPSPYRESVFQQLDPMQLARSEEFFAQRLADLRDSVLPFGWRDAQVPANRLDELRERLPPGLAEDIYRVAGRLGVSAATVFHAAWALVVAWSSGRREAIFGTVLSGRFHLCSDPHDAVGLFINTLPLRLQLEGLSVVQLIRRTHHELTDLLSHEQAPLSLAIACSGIPAGEPLFSTILNYYRNAPFAALESDRTGLPLRVLESRNWTNYPIAISVHDSGNDFSISVQAERSLNPRRILDYLSTALRSLTQSAEKSPQTPALFLQLTPTAVVPRDRRETFHESTQLIHQIFEAQVRQAPDATALVYNRESLSYSVLNSRANQLARYLKSLGVKSDVLVALCVERGLDMIVGIIGILKAGGGYLPLDPESPAERTQYILQDAAPQAVVTQSRFVERLSLASCPTVALDSGWTLIAQQSGADLENDGATSVEPGNLAYVIYTSGSTGRPKGVMVEHRNVTRLFAATRTWVDFAPTDVWSLFHSYAFDFSVWELWGALFFGARVVLVPSLIVRSPREFYRLLSEESVTALSQTPGAFRRVIDAQQAQPKWRHALRLVVFGGEQLDLSSLRSWIIEHGVRRPRLVNMYGITETTVHVTWQVLTDAEIHSESASIVGRPLADLDVYLLDAQGKAVPAGVRGEIYVGGSGVSRGYLNQPQLTAQRFMANPFSTEPGARMYRSGDLAVRRNDGTLEYLGRNDRQVKVRGFRIELGEIENQLSQQPSVKETAVIAREDIPGETRLVAYIVPKELDPLQSATWIETLRMQLRKSLPSYMVPGAFVVLESFPLTHHGKLDHRALPAPGISSASPTGKEPLQGGFETELARIWESVLRVSPIGRTDHFFELGGHSLLALKALLQINETFAQTLTVADLYRYPLLRDLAARVRGLTELDEPVELTREAAVDPDISVRSAPRERRSRCILLTGATGFVGRFLLQRLLNETDATLYCLVRSSDQDGRQRLTAVLKHWNLYTHEFGRRVVVLEGDLSQPLLGLRGSTYRMLCEEVDTVYHCATSMNHLETYWMAKSTNVGGAMQLARFATTGPLKVLNIVSTLSVFGSGEPGQIRVVDETSPLEHEKHLASDGYSASKWVSDQLFLNVAARGVPCNVFRLGLVWADSVEGRYDDLQREDRLVRSCLVSGLGIRKYHFEMIPTPVDHVARATVFLAERNRTGSNVFHISSSTETVGGLFERCHDVEGISLRLLEFADWVGEMRRLHLSGETLPIVPLIEPLFAMERDLIQKQQSRIETRRPHISCARTDEQLRSGNIVAPVFDEGLLRKYLRALTARGVNQVESVDTVRILATS